ncbi:MAG: tetratricopeptide repeat protein [Candidatus Omnitrophica bacterium]|nr:tetratricopeptide repeat protein [Candidatus Omnitrophota bacterium]
MITVERSIILFLIIFSGIIVYSNSLGGDFVWDDVAFVISNDFIKDLRLLPHYFFSKDALAKGTLAGENYRPLLILSYAVDYFFWKLNPLGYHLTNLFFHIANAILVFYLVLFITGKRIISMLASLFFLTHPIQTECVAWISGRADVLFLFFYLAAFIAYMGYIKRGRLPFYITSLLLFSCSLFSKEMAASFPFLIILYDIFYGRKEKISVRALRYFTFFLILASYVILRFNIIGKLAQCDYWTGDAYTTFLTMARGIVYYIRLLVYPVGLCADYVMFPASYSIKEPAVFLSIIAIILLIATAIKLAKKKKLVAFCVFWFFIALAPAANIIPIQILIAERFLYLPSVGYFIIIAALIVKFFDKIKKLRIFRYSLTCFSVFLVFVFSYLTMERNTTWSNDIAFSKGVLEKYPDNYRAHLNLSVAYYNAGDKEKSFEEAREALRVSPDENPSARRMIALYHIHNERLEEAIKQYREILKNDPQYIPTYTALAIVYQRQEKYDLAYNEYKKGLALNPDSIGIKISVATLDLLKGDVDSGIVRLNEILKEPPPHHARSAYAAAGLRLGDLYFGKGDNEKAVGVWQRVSEDFNDQIWFNEISKFLVGEITLQDLLRKTESWQPEFKVICYYYVGIKKEMDKDAKSAKAYYQKSIDVPVQTLEQIKVLAANRLEKMKKNSGIKEE